MVEVSVTACESYEPEAVRQAVTAAMGPLGGMARFVRPGMRVLLKPNLLSDTPPDRAVTTHPAVVQAVADLVQEAEGTAFIGDSPAGPMDRTPPVWHGSGMVDVADRTGAQLVPFDGVTWKRLNGNDYYIARPVLEADLVINLPKLKTHNIVLYTGAVKNLFGVIPGTRKREVHYRAPGVEEFSQALVDVLELARPGLTIMDGVLGQEGNGPGASGTPHRYHCLAASADPVALDAVLAQAMGYRVGEVRHLDLAGARGLGVSDPEAIQIVGDRQALAFGKLHLPQTWWTALIPSRIARLLPPARHFPELAKAQCIGCGRCVEVCPREAITPGQPAVFDLDECIGCLCCAEVCPQGAIEPHRNLIARLLGLV